MSSFEVFFVTSMATAISCTVVVLVIWLFKLRAERNMRSVKSLRRSAKIHDAYADWYEKHDNYVDCVRCRMLAQRFRDLASELQDD